MGRELNGKPTDCGEGLLVISCLDLAAQECRTACPKMQISEMGNVQTETI